MSVLLGALKALADPTRLTVLSVLEHRELSAGELTEVLGQSQPRVSRHLKLLTEAGVLERHQEGASAWFRVAREGTGAALAQSVLLLTDPSLPDLVRARERLERLRARRRAEASAYFETMADAWDGFSALHVSEAAIEARCVELLAGTRIRDLVDLGTGTGRMLSLMAPRCDRATGIDMSTEMLRVARSNLDRADLAHCRLRRGDLTDLRLPAGSADVAIAHHVLHFLDDPATAIAEAARILRPGGRLLIVDLAPHTLEALRAEQQHRRLGFGADEVRDWCLAAGFSEVTVEHLRREPLDTDEHLTITLWLATRASDALSHHRLEVA